MSWLWVSFATLAGAVGVGHLFLAQWWIKRHNYGRVQAYIGGTTRSKAISNWVRAAFCFAFAALCVWLAQP